VSPPPAARPVQLRRPRSRARGRVRGSGRGSCAGFVRGQPADHPEVMCAVSPRITVPVRAANGETMWDVPVRSQPAVEPEVPVRSQPAVMWDIRVAVSPRCMCEGRVRGQPADHGARSGGQRRGHAGVRVRSRPAVRVRGQPADHGARAANGETMSEFVCAVGPRFMREVHPRGSTRGSCARGRVRGQSADHGAPVRAANGEAMWEVSCAPVGPRFLGRSCGSQPAVHVRSQPEVHVGGSCARSARCSARGSCPRFVRRWSGRRWSRRLWRG
jgi:hypothetical protein